MKRAEAQGLKSGCAVPLILHGQALGTLSVVSTQEDAFTDDDAKLFSRIGAQVALAAANSMAYQEISSLKDKLAKEKLYWRRKSRSRTTSRKSSGTAGLSSWFSKTSRRWLRLTRQS